MRKKTGLTIVERAIIAVPVFSKVVKKIEQQVAIRGQSQSTLNNYVRRIAIFVLHFHDLPENICEDENQITKPYVLHAEANAITKIARSNNSSDNATMYVTASPCIECAKLIIQAGIKRVVYSEHYRLEDGIELLKRAGVEVLYVTNDNEQKQ